jgi:hypothetical protein
VVVVLGRVRKSIGRWGPIASEERHRVLAPNNPHSPFAVAREVSEPVLARRCAGGQAVGLPRGWPSPRCRYRRLRRCQTR